MAVLRIVMRFLRLIMLGELCPIGSIDPIREQSLTPRSLVVLDCSHRQSEQTVMLTTFVVIIACIAAGTIVHHRHHERRW
jgi:hypothetical protein